MQEQPFNPIEYINAPRWRNMRPGLERTQALLEVLGNPEDKLRFVHVAGTNGKGSTCAYLERILRECGFKTGLFTSPYIERFEERIRVCGRDIGHDDLFEATLEVKDAADEVERLLGEHPTEFELMTAVAFVHFASARCDICVVEVGLGGRLDSTNVIRPDACAISRIGLDHTELLGNTLGEIALEKAGIIKPHVPLACAAQEPEAMEAIESECTRCGSPLLPVDAEKLHRLELDMSQGRQTFEYKGIEYATRMLGAYAPENAALAIEACEALRLAGWEIPEDAMRAGIAQAAWPGRFEVLCREPFVIVDGSHNPQGAASLAASLERMNEKRWVFVCGVLADKDYCSMLEQLSHVRPLALIAYRPDNPRALDAETLAEAANRAFPDAETEAQPDARAALSKALEMAESVDGSVCAFGTLYSIGELKSVLASMRTDG